LALDTGWFEEKETKIFNKSIKPGLPIRENKKNVDVSVSTKMDDFQFC
jgi:hypothetical protein